MRKFSDPSSNLYKAKNQKIIIYLRDSCLFFRLLKKHFRPLRKCICEELHARIYPTDTHVLSSFVYRHKTTAMGLRFFCFLSVQLLPVFCSTGFANKALTPKKSMSDLFGRLTTVGFIFTTENCTKILSDDSVLTYVRGSLCALISFPQAVSKGLESDQ